MRRSESGVGAAPAREARNLAPGRSRDPTGGTTTPPQGALLDWGRSKGARTGRGATRR